jgi:maltodextrin utilization protein YvdJ
VVITPGILDMGKKERKEEKELIDQTREYKNSFRISFGEELFKEMEKRHANGEVFFEGQWVPQNKISKIQKTLIKRGWIVFLEIHLLILALAFFSLILWGIFKKLFLP